MSNANLSSLEIIRREKLNNLFEASIQPYPAPAFTPTHQSVSLLKQYQDLKSTENSKLEHIILTGRIMNITDKGKVFFLKIQDAEGHIQLYIKRDDLFPGDDKTGWDMMIKNALDIGDIIGVKGFMFTTKTGEPTLHVQEFKLLCKSLKPLPIVKVDESGQTHNEVVDPEFRYRQRYVDLILHPQVKDVFIKRTKIFNYIRQYLNAKGALEVDTPILQSIPGGALAKPFITHHNALDVPFFLRISNELYLKKLLVGGFNWVYEFSRDFRNEGMDRTHNPEFTILEWYTAYQDYLWMMDITEDLLSSLVYQLYGTYAIPVGEQLINFQKPFKRITMFDAIKEQTNFDLTDLNVEELKVVCKKLDIQIDPNFGKGKILDEIFSTTTEKSCIQPTFIIDYPIEMSPLTKKHRSKKGLVERFELMINGKEIANAYSELNDPIDQRARFEEQVTLKDGGDDEAMYIDYDFLRALEYGMPPASGIGIGMDRLCMLLTNQPSIQDVLFFPHMRPEKNLH
ncbi:MAG: lysine--tRNA ligase [Alphaproteobacteria bacterium]|nr:lysine--tRNA ligase [Alphaproteobacteria bacterium]